MLIFGDIMQRKMENIHFNFDKNSSRQKLSVWAGVCGNGTLLGPFFFERNVTGQANLEILNIIIPALLRTYGLNQ